MDAYQILSTHILLISYALDHNFLPIVMPRILTVPAIPKIVRVYFIFKVILHYSFDIILIFFFYSDWASCFSVASTFWVPAYCKFHLSISLLFSLASAAASPRASLAASAQTSSASSRRAGLAASSLTRLADSLPPISSFTWHENKSASCADLVWSWVVSFWWSKPQLWSRAVGPGFKSWDLLYKLQLLQKHSG